MKTPIHDLNDRYCISNSLGDEMHFSGELIAWNNIFLFFLAVASLMVMINRMKTNDDKHNALIKVLFGGLSIISLAGLLYPIEFGLIGINIAVTIILIVDFFKYDKTRHK